MISIDTNILVRLLTRDDPDAYARAEALVLGGDIEVSATVLLETEWVLRSVYDFSKQKILEALSGFLSMPGVEPMHGEELRRAIDWSRAGLDFADALHLAQTAAGHQFATFDESLVRRARKLDYTPVVLHPSELKR